MGQVIKIVGVFLCIGYVIAMILEMINFLACVQIALSDKNNTCNDEDSVQTNIKLRNFDRLVCRVPSPSWNKGHPYFRFTNQNENFTSNANKTLIGYAGAGLAGVNGVRIQSVSNFSVRTNKDVLFEDGTNHGNETSKSSLSGTNSRDLKTDLLTDNPEVTTHYVESATPIPEPIHLTNVTHPGDIVNEQTFNVSTTESFNDPHRDGMSNNFDSIVSWIDKELDKPDGAHNLNTERQLKGNGVGLFGSSVDVFVENTVSNRKENGSVYKNASKESNVPNQLPGDDRVAINRIIQNKSENGTKAKLLHNTDFRLTVRRRGTNDVDDKFYCKVAVCSYDKIKDTKPAVHQKQENVTYRTFEVKPSPNNGDIKEQSGKLMDATVENKQTIQDLKFEKNPIKTAPGIHKMENNRNIKTDVVKNSNMQAVISSSSKQTEQNLKSSKRSKNKKIKSIRYFTFGVSNIEINILCNKLDSISKDEKAGLGNIEQFTANLNNKMSINFGNNNNLQKSNNSNSEKTDAHNITPANKTIEFESKKKVSKMKNSQLFSILRDVIGGDSSRIKEGIVTSLLTSLISTMYGLRQNGTSESWWRREDNGMGVNVTIPPINPDDCHSSRFELSKLAGFAQAMAIVCTGFGCYFVHKNTIAPRREWMPGSLVIITGCTILFGVLGSVGWMAASNNKTGYFWAFWLPIACYMYFLLTTIGLLSYQFCYLGSRRYYAALREEDRERAAFGRGIEQSQNDVISNGGHDTLAHTDNGTNPLLENQETEPIQEEPSSNPTHSTPKNGSPRGDTFPSTMVQDEIHPVQAEPSQQATEVTGLPQQNHIESSSSPDNQPPVREIAVIHNNPGQDNPLAEAARIQLVLVGAPTPGETGQQEETPKQDLNSNNAPTQNQAAESAAMDRSGTPSEANYATGASNSQGNVSNNGQPALPHGGEVLTGNTAENSVNQDLNAQPNVAETASQDLNAQPVAAEAASQALNAQPVAAEAGNIAAQADNRAPQNGPAGARRNEAQDPMNYLPGIDDMPRAVNVQDDFVDEAISMEEPFRIHQLRQLRQMPVGRPGRRMERYVRGGGYPPAGESDDEEDDGFEET